MWEYNQAQNITFKVYLGLCHSTKKKNILQIFLAK